MEALAEAKANTKMKIFDFEAAEVRARVRKLHVYSWFIKVRNRTSKTFI